MVPDLTTRREPLGWSDGVPGWADNNGYVVLDDISLSGAVTESGRLLNNSRKGMVGVSLGNNGSGDELKIYFDLHS